MILYLCKQSELSYVYSKVLQSKFRHSCGALFQEQRHCCAKNLKQQPVTTCQQCLILDIYISIWKVIEGPNVLVIGLFLIIYTRSTAMDLRLLIYNNPSTTDAL